MEPTNNLPLPATTSNGEITNRDSSPSYLWRVFGGLSLWGVQDPSLIEKSVTPTLDNTVTTSTKAEASDVPTGWLSSKIDCYSKGVLKASSHDGTISVQNFYKLKNDSIYTLNDPLIAPDLEVAINFYEKSVPDVMGAYWISTKKGIIKAPKNGSNPLEFYPIFANEYNLSYLIPTHVYDSKALIVNVPLSKQFAIYDFKTDTPELVFEKDGFSDVYTHLNNDLILTYSKAMLQLWNIKTEQLEWSSCITSSSNVSFFQSSDDSEIVVGEGRTDLYVIDTIKRTVTNIKTSYEEGMPLQLFKFIDSDRFVCRYRDSNDLYICSIASGTQINKFSIGEHIYNQDELPLIIRGDQLVSLNPNDHKVLMLWNPSGSGINDRFEPADLSLNELYLSGAEDRIVGLHKNDPHDPNSLSVLYVWDFNTGKILLRNESKGAQAFANIAQNTLTIDCSNQGDFRAPVGKEKPAHPMDVKLTIWDLDNCRKAVDITETFAFATGPMKLMYSFQNTAPGKYNLEAWWGINHKMTFIKKSYTLK